MKVIDITAALERRKRAGRWTADFDASGELVIVGYDKQGDESDRLTWPANEAAQIVEALYDRLIQRRQRLWREANPQPPPPPPPKWSRCGCTKDGYYSSSQNGCNRRYGHAGPHRNRLGDVYEAAARHNLPRR